MSVRLAPLWSNNSRKFFVNQGKTRLRQGYAAASSLFLINFAERGVEKPKIHSEALFFGVFFEIIAGILSEMEQQAKEKSYAEYIAMVVIMLMAIGTVFVFSSAANVGQEVRLERFYDFPALRQILFFPLAVLVMYVVSCVDYRRLSLSKGWVKSPVVYLLGFSIALLILVLIPRFGTEVNYARRWLRIPAGPIGKLSAFGAGEMGGGFLSGGVLREVRRFYQAVLGEVRADLSCDRGGGRLDNY